MKQDMDEGRRLEGQVSKRESDKCEPAGKGKQANKRVTMKARVAGQHMSKQQGERTARKGGQWKVEDGT